MRSGKIKDAVLKRSVMNLIDYKNKKVISGAGIGRDCSVIDAGDKYVLTSTEIAVDGSTSGPAIAVVKAANNIVCAGGIPVSASAAFCLSEDYKEKYLKELTRKTVEGCQMAGVQLAGGHTEITAGAAYNIMTVTITGICDKENYHRLAKIPEAIDIVIAGWTGLEGTALMYENNREELLLKLPAAYIDRASDFVNMLFMGDAARIAYEQGALAMHDASEGGMFAALWDFSEAAGCGFEIDLQAVPIKQETVEFCEFYDINPYFIKSSGAVIIAAPDGAQVVTALEEAGIHAAVVGKTISGKDKRVVNHDEVRFLDKP